LLAPVVANEFEKHEIYQCIIDDYKKANNETGYWLQQTSFDEKENLKAWIDDLAFISDEARVSLSLLADKICPYGSEKDVEVGIRI
jgi:hypothetical protein